MWPLPNPPPLPSLDTFILFIYLFQAILWKLCASLEAFILRYELYMHLTVFGLLSNLKWLRVENIYTFWKVEILRHVGPLLLCLDSYEIATTKCFFLFFWLSKQSKQLWQLKKSKPINAYSPVYSSVLEVLHNQLARIC